MISNNTYASQPDGPEGPADDGKRREAEWTVVERKFKKQRGESEGGGGLGIGPDRRLADDGKRFQAVDVLCGVR